MSSFKLGNLDEETLFTKMEDAFKNGYLMLAYNDFTINKKNGYEKYFEKDYFYPIVACVTADSNKMIFLRNIWKKMEYDLYYYKSQENFSQHVIRNLEKYEETSVSVLSN